MLTLLVVSKCLQVFPMQDKEKGIFLEVDNDLRRVGALKSAYLPVCSRGATCDRKNAQHFRQFRHSVELNSIVSHTKFSVGTKKKKAKKKKSNLQISVEKSKVRRTVRKCQLPVTFGGPDTGYLKPENNASTSTFSSSTKENSHCLGEPKRDGNEKDKKVDKISKRKSKKTVQVSLY